MTMPTPEVNPPLNELIRQYDVACEDLLAGDWVRAQRSFEQLVQAAALEPRFYFGLGLSLQQQGLVERAARQFAICTHLNPSDAASAFRLGECLQALGEEAGAQETFHDALKLCNLPGVDPQLRQLIEARLQSL